MSFFSHTGSDAHLKATGNSRYYTKKEREAYRESKQKQEAQEKYESENPVSMGSNGFDD